MHIHSEENQLKSGKIEKRMQIDRKLILKLVKKLKNMPSWKSSKWDKVFKNVPSKFCERQPFKDLK